MVWTGSNDARSRALHKRRYEYECLVQGGWRVEYSRIGHDSDEAGQDENGEGKGFRPRRQAGNPSRVLGVIGDRVLYVRIHQDIYIWKEHLQSERRALEIDLVVLCIERSQPVEVNPGTGMHATDGH